MLTNVNYLLDNLERFFESRINKIKKHIHYLKLTFKLLIVGIVVSVFMSNYLFFILPLTLFILIALSMYNTYIDVMKKTKSKKIVKLKNLRLILINIRLTKEAMERYQKAFPSFITDNLIASNLNRLYVELCDKLEDKNNVKR